MASRRSRWTLGPQHAVVTSQPSPARGGLITMAGRRLTATLGPSTSPSVASRITALPVPCGTLYAIRLVTWAGTVPGARARSTSTATAPDEGMAGTGLWVKSSWVAAASVSPSIRPSSVPARSRTVTLDRVTGSLTALTTSRSYSTWSLPSWSPRTTCASWIGRTVIALSSGLSFPAPATAVADIATDAATTATSAAIGARREIDPQVMARSFAGGCWCAASRIEDDGLLVEETEAVEISRHHRAVAHAHRLAHPWFRVRSHAQTTFTGMEQSVPSQSASHRCARRNADAVGVSTHTRRNVHDRARHAYCPDGGWGARRDGCS